MSNEHRTSLSDISGVVTLRHIAQASSPAIKVTWIAILILSVGLCSGIVLQLLSDYVEKPIVSIQELHTPKELQFPTITLCPYIRANASLVTQYNYSQQQITYLMAVFDGLYRTYPSYSQAQFESLEKSLLNETKDIKRFFLVTVGILCEAILKHCSFQGSQFNCCANSKRFLSDTGTCLTLNIPKRNQSIPGIKGGLTVHFQVFEEDYPLAYYYNYPNEGLALHITDPAVTSQNLTSNPVILSSKRYVMIQLRKQNTNLNNYHGCVDAKSEKVKNRLKYFDVYSQDACMNECIMNATLSRCGCSLIGSVDSAMYIPLCNATMAIRCAHPVRSRILEYLTIDNCSCYSSCIFTNYKTQFGMMKVPSTGYMDAMYSELNIDPSWADGRIDTAATLNIYFRDFCLWTTILRPRFTFPELISLVGSQLSLWIGVRIITFLEIIYVCGRIWTQHVHTAYQM